MVFNKNYYKPNLPLTTYIYYLLKPQQISIFHPNVTGKSILILSNSRLY